MTVLTYLKVKVIFSEEALLVPGPSNVGGVKITITKESKGEKLEPL